MLQKDQRLLFGIVVLVCNVVITSDFIVRTKIILHRQMDRKVTLPVAADRRSFDQDTNTLKVTMAQDGHLEVDRKQIGEAQFLELVADRHESRVKVIALRGVRYEDLKRLLKALGAQGVGRIVFSVVDSTPEKSFHAVSREKSDNF